jgi:hypothetical protein
MRFIEAVFGLSPDGGSGMLESAIFLVFAAVTALSVLYARTRRTRRSLDK